MSARIKGPSFSPMGCYNLHSIQVLLDASLNYIDTLHFNIKNGVKQ